MNLWTYATPEGDFSIVEREERTFIRWSFPGPLSQSGDRGGGGRNRRTSDPFLCPRNWQVIVRAIRRSQMEVCADL